MLMRIRIVVKYAVQTAVGNYNQTIYDIFKTSFFIYFFPPISQQPLVAQASLLSSLHDHTQ